MLRLPVLVCETKRESQRVEPRSNQFRRWVSPLGVAAMRRKLPPHSCRRSNSSPLSVQQMTASASAARATRPMRSANPASRRGVSPSLRFSDRGWDGALICRMKRSPDGLVCQHYDAEFFIAASFRTGAFRCKAGTTSLMCVRSPGWKRRFQWRGGRGGATGRRRVRRSRRRGAARCPTRCGRRQAAVGQRVDPPGGLEEDVAVGGAVELADVDADLVAELVVVGPRVGADVAGLEAAAEVGGEDRGDVVLEVAGPAVGLRRRRSGCRFPGRRGWGGRGRRRARRDRHRCRDRRRRGRVPPG